jgi:hypothetical protein
MDVWGGAFGSAWGNSWGLTVVVVTQPAGGGGGGYRSYTASNADELRLLAAQIEYDDQEILAVIIAAVQVGVFP